METLAASAMVISATFPIVVDDLGLNLDTSRVPRDVQQWQVCVTNYSTVLSSSNQKRVYEWYLQEVEPSYSVIIQYDCSIFARTLHFSPTGCWWGFLGH